MPPDCGAGLLRFMVRPAAPGGERDKPLDFTFLHAADLHLGSPLAGLATKDEEVARRFAAASREAFSDLVTRMIEAGARFAVIAGDIYDGEWKDNSIGLFFNREIARLARAGIPVFVVKGNHDAASVVTRTIPLPESVFEFPVRAAETRRIEELKVAVHGRSFPDRAVGENYALAYPEPLPGYFNIGLLHTSCTGRPPHADYAPCSVQDLAGRGYQYWALGHVHEHEVLCRDPWIVYPGNLQGRSVRECGPKGAVLVDVADGQVLGEPRRLLVDRARWAAPTVDLTGVEDEAAALGAISDALAPIMAEAEGRLVAVRVTLSGATALHRRLKAERRRLADEVQALAHHLAEDVWIETLRVDTSEPELAAAAAPSALDPVALLAGLEHDPELRRAAAEILAGLAAKVPAGIEWDGPLAESLDGLLADARALVLDRAARKAA